MTTRKRHDNEHFLKAKKTRANLKLLFNSGSEEFPLVSCVFFYSASVMTEASVFGEEGLEPNQIVRKV
jgi:hypothetical protein